MKTINAIEQEITALKQHYRQPCRIELGWRQYGELHREAAAMLAIQPDGPRIIEFDGLPIVMRPCPDLLRVVGRAR